MNPQDGKQSFPSKRIQRLNPTHPHTINRKKEAFRCVYKVEREANLTQKKTEK